MIKLINDEVRKNALRLAVKDASSGFEQDVIKVYKNSMINVNVQSKLEVMLEHNPNLELSHSFLIRQVQSAVKKAFDNRSNSNKLKDHINEAMELLAMASVVADKTKEDELNMEPA